MPCALNASLAGYDPCAMDNMHSCMPDAKICLVYPLPYIGWALCPSCTFEPPLKQTRLCPSGPRPCPHFGPPSQTRRATHEVRPDVELVGAEHAEGLLPALEPSKGADAAGEANPRLVGTRRRSRHVGASAGPKASHMGGSSFKGFAFVVGVLKGNQPKTQFRGSHPHDPKV